LQNTWEGDEENQEWKREKNNSESEEERALVFSVIF